MTNNNATTTTRLQQRLPEGTLWGAPVAKGISQVDLADVSGVPLSWISALERRCRRVSRRVAERRAGELHATATDAPFAMGYQTVDRAAGRGRAGVCP